MKRIGVGLLLLCVAASALAQRVERNSFLAERVTSASALIAQFKTNPAVRDRFLRHYAMDADGIESFFATFRIGKIRETGVFRVYGVGDDGKIHATAQTLKKGALVFVDLGGAPVMRMSCGNPMTLGPTDPMATNDVDAEVVGAQETTLEELAASEETSVAELTAETVDLEPTFAPVPEVEVIPGVVPKVTETGFEGPQIALPGGGFNLGRLFPAVLLLTQLPKGSSPTPIPEPATLAALCVGFGGLLLKRKRLS